ncbi:MAG: TPM domain-containing protein [Ferruginibacter sp.]
MFSFFKKKDLFTPEENERIVSAIRRCETLTSGEMRVYIEAKNPLVDPLERAAVVFTKLQMQLTQHRNGVLLYIATKHKEVALLGDEGIYQQVGKDFWEAEVQSMVSKFGANGLLEGIEQCVLHVGDVLHEKFPYVNSEDKNELPDEIVFGKL